MDCEGYVLAEIVRETVKSRSIQVLIGEEGDLLMVVVHPTSGGISLADPGTCSARWLGKRKWRGRWTGEFLWDADSANRMSVTLLHGFSFCTQVA